MALIQDSGVTLRRLDYAETSQVIVFFTREHGRVRAIAKGVKRSTKTRFAVGIDLLEVGELVVSIRQPRQEALAILTEWKQRAALSGLRRKLARLNAAQYACEIIAALTEDWDPHPALHDALVRLLVQLSEADEVLAPEVEFQAVLLHEIGLWPQWDRCVSCQRPPNTRGDVYFSSFEGGVLCRDCEHAFSEKRLLDRGAWELLRAGYLIPARPAAGGEPVPVLELRGAFDALNYHLSHLMGRAPLLASKMPGGKQPLTSPNADLQSMPGAQSRGRA